MTKLILNPDIELSPNPDEPNLLELAREKFAEESRPGKRKRDGEATEAADGKTAEEAMLLQDSQRALPQPCRHYPLGRPQILHQFDLCFKSASNSS